MTKMYEEYVKKTRPYVAQYGPNTVLFLLVGSFYSLYDILDRLTGEPATRMRDAVRDMNIELVLKKGDGPGGADALMAGFPSFKLHEFAGKLTRTGWTVVVEDQDEPQRGQRKLNRSLARVLSPGTHVEAMEMTTEAVYVAGLWLDPGTWTDTAGGAPAFGACALDLTTGFVHTYAGSTVGRREEWSSDDLLHFFAVHPPREIVVWWRGHPVDAPAETALRRRLSLPPGTMLHVRAGTAQAQGVLEKPLVREDILRQSFKPRTMLPLHEALGLSGATPSLERALVSLLAFVGEHYPAAREHLHPPVSWSPADAVVLGNHALTQLNMIVPGKEEDSVLGLFSRTATPLGKRAMRQRLLYPICDAAVLEARYEAVGWWQSAPKATQEQLHTLLRQIADISRLHRRLTMAEITPQEVVLLDTSYQLSLQIADTLAGTPVAFPEGTDFRGAYLSAFAALFDVEKAKTYKDGNSYCLQAAVAPKTAELEGKIATSLQRIQELYREVLERLGGLEPSQLRMEEKEASLLLTGSKTTFTAVKGAVERLNTSGPTHLRGLQIHAKKSSGSLEVPALNEEYRKLLRLRETLHAVVREEAPPLLAEFAAIWMQVWDTLEGWVGMVDVTGTLARVATERGFCRPQLREGVGAGASVSIRGLRHPLIEAQQTRLEYVRHDVELGDPVSGWLVYGMNASGKSSLMKAVGIAVLLAQAGSFVPAEEMTLAPFRALFTRILSTDNLWAGLSSFAVEMTELRQILGRADAWSLVLGDEVCSGTESTSATALVGATLEWFAERGVRYIFATHLHGLQTVRGVMDLPGLRVWHLRVRYDPATEKLYYDRTLQPGAGNSLYGLEVARAMCIPFEVLEKAHSIRRGLVGAVAEEEAPASDWNATVTRKMCELCGHEMVRELEVHHIRPRAEASASGHFTDGSRMNDLRNLVVVCQGCHDRHHAGQLTIGTVKMTSEGPEREVIAAAEESAAAPDLAQFAYTPPGPARRPGGLSDEDLEKVRAFLRKYPNCPPSRVLLDLERESGIKLTKQRLATIRASL